MHLLLSARVVGYAGALCLIGLLCGCFDSRQQVSVTPSYEKFIREGSAIGLSSHTWFSDDVAFENYLELPSSTKQEEDPEFEGKIWLCKRELLKNRVCTAVAYDGFLEIARESKEIPSGEDGCSPEVCSQLFETRFSKLAHVYEHEGD